MLLPILRRRECGRGTDVPPPRPALASEIDRDPDLAQEGCRPPQTARRRPRAVRPCLGLGDSLARHVGQGAQKIGGGPRPFRPRNHHRAHGGGDRIDLRLIAAAAIGYAEGAGRPGRVAVLGAGAATGAAGDRVLKRGRADVNSHPEAAFMEGPRAIRLCRRPEAGPWDALIERFASPEPDFQRVLEEMRRPATAVWIGYESLPWSRNCPWDRCFVLA
jgi:hypothetical protein